MKPTRLAYRVTSCAKQNDVPRLPSGNTRESPETAGRDFKDIPGPVTVPLFGNLKKGSNIQEYPQHLLSLHEKYGLIVKQDLGFGRGNVVHVFDPEDARTVFNSDGKQPHIVPLQETTLKYRQMRGINPGLGNLNGDEWYRLRSSIQQAMMRPQAVIDYLPFANRVADRLIAHMMGQRDPAGEVDMRKIAGRWSLESAGLIVFEKILGALSDNVAWADTLVGINKEIFQLSAKLRFGLPFFRFISTPKWNRMVQIEDIFYGEVEKLMDEAILNLTANKSRTDMLFASYLVNRPELTKTDIKVILLSLFSDGLSTTAPMLVYNLFNIAKHKEIQERLREEVTGVVSPSKEIDSVVLGKLPFLKACIKETFRLFPIGTEVSRIPQKDLVLGGYNVPAGTPVDINTNILNRSPSLFSDPSTFKPTRWLRDSEEQEKSHPFALLPFGFGPRMCAGRRFAEQDLQVVLARLVSAFKIEHLHLPITQVYETLLLPRGNCSFKVTPIE